MKTNNKILIFALAASVLAGCNFFDNNSPSASMSDEMFSSIANTELAISGVYELFGTDRGYRNRLTCGYAGLNTDIEYCRKSSSDYARYQIKVTDTDLSNAKGNDSWGYLTAMIERCNNIVDGIDKYGYASVAVNQDTYESLTEQQKQKAHTDTLTFDYLKGEALFLRGFALLEMVKYWGDVPVNVKAYDGQSLAEVSSAKVDRNVAFEQIRKDLKQAAELMDWSGSAQLTSAVNDVRRPSKAAALGLLARADLMYAGKAVRPTSLTAGNASYTIDWNIQDQSKRVELYQEVMWACDTIIRQEGDAKLLDGYAQVFKNICADVTDYSKMEHIWVIPMANGARGQVMNYNCAKFNSKNIDSKGDYTMGILLHNIEYSTNVSSNFSLSMVPTLLFDYENEDQRREVTVLPYKWQTASRGAGPNHESIGRGEKSQICLYPKLQSDASQWACGKYRIEWMSRDNNSTDDGIDFPVLRMSDIYLMFAEASIGSNDEMEITPKEPTFLTGQEAFDKVRTRAAKTGMSLEDKTLDLAAIQEERKLEFAGEYIRKWDLMRWGILKDALVKAHEELERFRAEEDAHVLYVKYKQDDSYLQAGAKDLDGNIVRCGYVIDEVYGFRLDDSGTKSGDLWKSEKCKFADKLVDTDYILYNYEDPESINSHQYWPIFATIVGSSNGQLFNNYGY